MAKKYHPPKNSFLKIEGFSQKVKNCLPEVDNNPRVLVFCGLCEKSPIYSYLQTSEPAF